MVGWCSEWVGVESVANEGKWSLIFQGFQVGIQFGQNVVGKAVSGGDLEF